MWYLGGECRQAKAIVDVIKGEVGEDWEGIYVEPFCGAMWSATAMIRAFPNGRFFFSDIHPALVGFWAAAIDGWDPPENVSEEEYVHYRDSRDLADPMTGYVGFAWSFGGKYFGGAARSDGEIKGSYRSTMKKIEILRSADVRVACLPYGDVRIPLGSVAYLDPPYQFGRTPQAATNGPFDRGEFVRYAEGAAGRARLVLASEFVNDAGWEVVHNWGDTVVRHHTALAPDGTVELLMRVGGGHGS